jgi:hypothetical protein
VRLVAALVDRWNNAGVEAEGAIEIEAAAGLDGPARLPLPPEAAGVAEARFVARTEGVHRIRARGPGGLVGESNPLLVAPQAPRLCWGDLHGHSHFSDGTGTPEDYFRYARDVAGLDVAALTDHDHWGTRHLDERPDLWDETRASVARFDAPGRFVALLGYEWTSWLHGHRHVLFFGEEGRIFSSLDAATDTPSELWMALRGQRALTFPHHPAGSSMALNWAFRSDPVLEPLVEIVSLHGSSESADSPGPIRSAVSGNTVRDALALGRRFGFVGSGDSHHGHPGVPQPDKVQGGLAGIRCEARNREAIFDALRERHTYATNGPRIWLEARLDGAAMGAVLPGRRRAELAVEVVGTGPLDRVDVVRSGAIVERLAAGGALELTRSLSLDALAPGEWVYVRAVQRDGGAAWSSPFFFE